MGNRKRGFVAAVLIGMCLSLLAQRAMASTVGQSAVENLTLSPGDIITVHIFDNPEMDQQHIRVTEAGTIPLLLLGSLKVGGLTPGQAADAIAKAYTDRKLLRNVHVAVTVETYASLSVTVVGYVNGATASAATNGLVVPLPAPKSLLTVLAMAGGLSEKASREVTIKRADPNSKPETVFIPNDPMTSLKDDVMVYPGDTVIIPRAGIVYVLGDVGAAKGVIMEQDDRLSLLEALSLAGSTMPNAKTAKLMVFRKEDGKYQAIHVNMEKILHGKAPDMQMQAEDVIWVPFSYGRNLLINAASITAAVSSATASSIIYTHP